MKYQEFAESIKLKYAKESGKYATFVPNKKLPVYNWFYYKEGFSRDLIVSLIEIFDLINESVVLDPFCGSGTTLLACKQKGISSIGFDVLPISVFAAKTKTTNYDPKDLKETAKILLKTKFKPTGYSYPQFMKNAFNRFVLEDISVFRNAIMEIENKKNRDFFLLAFVNAAMRCSYAWKDGGVLKFKKKSVPPLRIMLRRVVYNMIRDIEHFESTHCTTIIEKGDARRMKVEDSSVDAIITSPPYLNNIDYTKVYEIEQFIINEQEAPGIRSYIGSEKDIENSILPELEIPPQAVAYFTDMFAVLQEMKRVLKEGSHAAIIVGNGYFPSLDKIIDSDLILAYLASKIGFSIEDIIVMNERFALAHRTQKRGILRESMLILKKY